MSKFRSFLKWSVATITILSLTWVSIILWWQNTQRVITFQDAVFYLLVLPSSFFICFFSGKKLFFKKKMPDVPFSEKMSLPQEAGMSADIIANSVSQLPVVGAWCATPFADNVDSFGETISARQKRPSPDRILTDRQGFPVLAGRVHGLDTHDVRDTLLHAATNNRQKDSIDFPEWRDAFIRTLALLGNTMDQVEKEWPLPTNAQTHDTRSTSSLNTLRGATPPPAEAVSLLDLQIKLIIPAHFGDFERQLARAYLSKRVADFFNVDQYTSIDVIGAKDDITALRVIDAFNLESSQSEHLQALLLLACDSALCHTVIDGWEANDHLFGAHRPEGLMSGEAAFGTLLTNTAALRAYTLVPLCHVSRMAYGRRDSAADTQGKSSDACLAGVLQEALAQSRVPAGMIGAVVCDADHRSSRVLECMKAMMLQLPQLDAIQNRFAVNEVCGHIGAASVLGAIVGAVMQAVAEEHQVMLFSVIHELERAAAVLSPASSGEA